MRILLVEDDPEQLEPLQAALTHAGHVVDAVEDGATAPWMKPGFSTPQLCGWKPSAWSRLWWMPILIYCARYTAPGHHQPLQIFDDTG